MTNDPRIKPTRRRIPIIRRRNPAGTAPGSLPTSPPAQPTTIDIIGYGAPDLIERTLERVDQIPPLLAAHDVVWINIVGVQDADILRSLGDTLDIHRLTLEDVANVHQRPKAEMVAPWLFLVARMVTAKAGTGAEQISMLIRDGVIITFQERPGDVFEPVRQRLRAGAGRIRTAGSDYLGYALLDAVIDAYFPILESYGDRIADLEEAIFAGADSRDAIGEIHAIKRDLLILRRTIAPHREVLHHLERDDVTILQPATRLYLRDCYDHVIQLNDLVETYRDLTSGLLDVHLTAAGNRMNEIMKVLTIFAAIFIPLSFIAGLYGMNFDTSSPMNMPELRWAYGYPAALLLMASVAGGLLLLFWRRGWFR